MYTNPVTVHTWEKSATHGWTGALGAAQPRLTRSGCRDLAHGGAGDVPAADHTGDPSQARQPPDLVAADVQHARRPRTP
ncbi:MAG: hypothetical protein WBL35_13645 [Ornithinibacter sp.]